MGNKRHAPPCSPYHQGRVPKVATVPPVRFVAGGHHPLLNDVEPVDTKKALVELPGSRFIKANDLMAEEKRQLAGPEAMTDENGYPAYFQMVRDLTLNEWAHFERLAFRAGFCLVAAGGQGSGQLAVPVLKAAIVCNAQKRASM